MFGNFFFFFFERWYNIFSAYTYQEKHFDFCGHDFNPTVWKVSEFGVFFVHIFLYSDWIQENTDQKTLCIWTLYAVPLAQDFGVLCFLETTV